MIYKRNILYVSRSRRFDFKYKDEFLELEREAKENGRGVWE